MTYHDEYTGCPGRGEYEGDCRCTREDYDRFTWKPGDVQLVEPDRKAYDGAPGTSDFEWWPDGLLDQEPPPQGFVARLRYQEQ